MHFRIPRLPSFSKSSHQPKIYAHDDLAIAHIILGPTTINPIYEPLHPSMLPVTWRYIVACGPDIADAARLENAFWRLWGMQVDGRTFTKRFINECTASEYGSLLGPVVVSPTTLQRSYQSKSVLYYGQLSAMANRHRAVGLSQERTKQPLDEWIVSSSSGDSESSNVNSSPLSRLSTLSYLVDKSPVHPPRRVRFNAVVEQRRILSDYAQPDSDAETEEADDVEWGDMSRKNIHSCVTAKDSSHETLLTAANLVRLKPVTSIESIPPAALYPKAMQEEIGSSVYHPPGVDLDRLRLCTRALRAQKSCSKLRRTRSCSDLSEGVTHVDPDLREMGTTRVQRRNPIKRAKSLFIMEEENEKEAEELSSTRSAGSSGTQIPQPESSAGCLPSSLSVEAAFPEREDYVMMEDDDAVCAKNGTTMTSLLGKVIGRWL